MHGAGLQYRERLIAVVEGLGKGHLTQALGRHGNGRRRHIDAPGLHRSKEAVKGNIAKLKLPAQRLREGPGEIDLKADVLPIPRLELPGHIADVRPHHQGLRAKALGRDQNPKEKQSPSPAP